jgi:hypothetical protein
VVNAPARLVIDASRWRLVREPTLGVSGRTATPFGKIGMQPHTPLETITPISLALAVDRRHSCLFSLCSSLRFFVPLFPSPFSLVTGGSVCSHSVPFFLSTPLCSSLSLFAFCSHSVLGKSFTCRVYRATLSSLPSSRLPCLPCLRLPVLPMSPSPRASHVSVSPCFPSLRIMCSDNTPAAFQYQLP